MLKAVAERVNNAIKNELLKGMRFSSIDFVSLCCGGQPSE